MPYFIGLQEKLLALYIFEPYSHIYKPHIYNCHSLGSTLSKPHFCIFEPHVSESCSYVFEPYISASHSHVFKYHAFKPRAFKSLFRPHSFRPHLIGFLYFVNSTRSSFAEDLSYFSHISSETHFKVS